MLVALRSGVAILKDEMTKDTGQQARHDERLPGVTTAAAP